MQYTAETPTPQPIRDNVGTPAAFDPAWLQESNAMLPIAADVADFLAAQGLELTKTGPWYHTNCPFHDDNRNQLRILNENVFTCLDPACKTAGNLTNLARFFTTGDKLPTGSPISIKDLLHEKAREDRARSVIAHEFLAKNIPPYSWLIEGMVPAIGLTALLGYYKVGKSVLAIQLGLSLSRGLPFMAAPTQHCPVLFLEEEGSESGLHKRMRDMDSLFSIPAYKPPFYVWARPGLRLDDEEDLDDLSTEVKKTGAKLAIVGTMAASTGLDENNNPAIARFAYRLNSLAHELGIAIVLPHHMRKPDERRPPQSVQEVMNMSRGASSLIGATESNIAIIRPYDETIGKMYLLPREAKAAILQYELDFSTMLMFPTDKQPNQRVTKDNEIMHALYKAGAKTSTYTLARTLGISDDTARKRLLPLADEGLVDKTVGLRGAIFWTLADAGGEQLLGLNEQES